MVIYKPDAEGWCRLIVDSAHGALLLFRHPEVSARRAAEESGRGKNHRSEGFTRSDAAWLRRALKTPLRGQGACVITTRADHATVTQTRHLLQLRREAIAGQLDIVLTFLANYVY
jgi:hypothetical protein